MSLADTFSHRRHLWAGSVYLVLLLLLGGTLGPLHAAPGSAPIPVSGRVLGPDSRPLADARVTVHPDGGGYRSREVRTDSAGRFRIDAPGGFAEIRIDHPAVLPATALVAVVDPLELETLRLPPARTVAVQVFDPEGAALPGARVAVAPALSPRLLPFPWRVARRHGAADAAGGVALPALPGETLRVEVWFPGHGVATATAPPAVDSLRVTLHPAATVSTRIAAADGVALGEVAVRSAASGLEIGRTDPQGEVPLTTIVPGPLVAAEDSLALPLTPVEPGLLRAPPVARLRGRAVEGSSGQGLAGTLVWLADQPRVRTVAGAGGRFELVYPPVPDSATDPAAGGPAVQAAAPGFLPTAALADGTRPVTLTLRPAAVLRGRVRAGGEPLPGAVVQVFAAGIPAEGSHRPAATTTTGPGGAFRLGSLSAESTYRVRAEAPGCSAVERAWRPGNPNITFLELDLPVRRGAFGRVLSESSGEPVPGARVELVPLTPTPAEPLRALTDDGGRYELPDLHAASYRLEASAPDHGSAVVNGLPVPPAGGAPAIDLGTIYLPPGVELPLRVQSDRGEEVPGARVRVVPWRPDASGAARTAVEPRTARTDEEGRAVLLGLTEHEILDLEIGADGYLPWRRDRVAARDLLAEGEPVFELRAAGRVRGRVLTADGETPRAGYVSARREAAVQEPGEPEAAVRRERPLGAPTDADGRFEIQVPPDEPVLLEARAAGFVPAESPPLTVAAGETRDGVLLRLEEGAAVSGRITADGRPVAAAVVRLGEEPTAVSGRTDGDGLYALRGVPLGNRRAVVRHPDFLPLEERLEVTGGEQIWDARLRPGQILRGRVIDSDDRPVARAEVTARGSESTVRGATTTGADGTFSFRNLPAEAHELQVRAGGRSPVTHPEPVTPTPPPGAEVLLRLPSSATVTGTVTGLSLDELAWTEVSAEGRSGSDLRRGELRYDGTYRIDGLAPGSWVVRATSADGARSVSRPITLRAEETARVELAFEGGHSLEGRITLTDGGPPTEAFLVLEGLDRPSRVRGRTDAAGVFRLDGLEAGRHVLHVLVSATGSHHRQPVEVPGSGWVEIRLPEATPNAPDD